MGSGLLAPGLALDLESRLADGGNLYSAYAESPLLLTDPTGLVISLPGLLISGADQWQAASGALQEAAAGLTTLMQLADMLEGYSYLQEYDADWALDWDQRDDWLYSVPSGSGGSAADDGYEMAAGRGGGAARRAARGGDVDFDEWLKEGPANVKVYLRRDKQTGRYDYAGIMNDIDRRQRQWGDSFELENLRLGALTRNEARCVEEAILSMRKFSENASDNRFTNKIHSISPNRAFHAQALARGKRILEQHGIDIKNDN